MNRILLCEDEANIRDPLVDFLEIEGYEVEAVATGEEALSRHAARKSDLILLDVMLPGMDGFEVCRCIRATDGSVPILFLTARGEESDRVLGLDGGADDYVTKPFRLAELAARIRAHLRRVRRIRKGLEGAAGEPSLRAGRLQVWPETGRVEREGAPLDLTAMELDLLLFFLNSPKEVSSRERILAEVWGYDRFPTTRTVDTHVYKLRQKLEADPENPTHLVTVHGRGYRWQP